MNGSILYADYNHLFGLAQRLRPVEPWLDAKSYQFDWLGKTTFGVMPVVKQYFTPQEESLLCPILELKHSY